MDAGESSPAEQSLWHHRRGGRAQRWRTPFHNVTAPTTDAAKDVEWLNDYIRDPLPNPIRGVPLYSADSAESDGERDAAPYPIEFLNSPNLPKLTPHNWDAYHSCSVFQWL